MSEVPQVQVEALADALEHYRIRHRMTYMELEQESGISAATICRFINRVGRPRMATVEAINDFLGQQVLAEGSNDSGAMMTLLEDQDTCYCGEYCCDRSQDAGREWSNHSATVFGIFQCENCGDWLLPWGCILRGDDPPGGL